MAFRGWPFPSQSRNRARSASLLSQSRRNSTVLVCRKAERTIFDISAAVEAASFKARLVHLGTSAGAQATLPSAAIRGKMLVIMGLSYAAAPPDTKRAGYEWLIGAAARGELSVEIEALPLERVAEAWQRVEAGAHRKIVLVPATPAQEGDDR